MYADDQIIFQSVKFEALLLGATDPTAGALSATRRRGGADQMALGYCDPVPSLRLRVPLPLQREAKAEVNGSLELRCFTIKLYGRPSRGMLVTGLHRFRLYHPEAACKSATPGPTHNALLRRECCAISRTRVALPWGGSVRAGVVGPGQRRGS